MEWPLQDTGKFEPPACVVCCAVPEAHAYVQGYRMTIDGQVRGSGDAMNTNGFNPTLVIEIVPSDPESNIVAIGQLTWTSQVFGDLTGTTEECKGCYGYNCLDGDGNPIGGTHGYFPGLITNVWDFYVLSLAEHGKATDLGILYNFTIPQGLNQNAPACEEFGADVVSFIRTITW